MMNGDVFCILIAMQFKFGSLSFAQVLIQYSKEIFSFPKKFVLNLLVTKIRLTLILLAVNAQVLIETLISGLINVSRAAAWTC